MHLQRRSFLKNGIQAAVSAGLVLTGARLVMAQKGERGRVTTTVVNRYPQIPIQAQQDPIFLFTRATFDPYLGGYFEAPNALGQMVELKLIKVTTCRSVARLTNRSRETDCFSLTFTASGQLPQFTSIHKISHPSLGKFYLFLTRRDGEGGELFYEAVFNHIR